jgi:ribosome-binding factor A
MANRRKKRVEELLRDEICEIVRRRMDDGVTPFMSITSVEVSRDFSTAKVFVSFLNPEDSAAHMRKLKKAQGFIRAELNKVIRLRRIPKLNFQLDDGIARAFRLEEIFARINENEQADTGDSE